jgi:hypothetical protein
MAKMVTNPSKSSISSVLPFLVVNRMSECFGVNHLGKVSVLVFRTCSEAFKVDAFAGAAKVYGPRTRQIEILS